MSAKPRNRRCIQKSAANLDDVDEFPLQILELVPGRRKKKHVRPRIKKKDESEVYTCPDEFYPANGGEPKIGKEFVIRLFRPADLLSKERKENRRNYHDLKLNQLRGLKQLKTKISVKPRRNYNNNSPKSAIVKTWRGRRSISQQSSSHTVEGRRSSKVQELIRNTGRWIWFECKDDYDVFKLLGTSFTNSKVTFVTIKTTTISSKLLIRTVLTFQHTVVKPAFSFLDKVVI